jgi:hypothetical protein
VAAGAADKELSMKPCVLFVVTPATILLTGLTLAWAGWFMPHSPSLPRPAEAQVDRDDPLAGEAVWRWRDGQPHHWHSCLLRR